MFDVGLAGALKRNFTDFLKAYLKDNNVTEKIERFATYDYIEKHLSCRNTLTLMIHILNQTRQLT